MSVALPDSSGCTDYLPQKPIAWTGCVHTLRMCPIVINMMTSSNGNIFRVTSFDVFFDLRLNERLSKQSWGWWFDTPSPSLWRHSNVYLFVSKVYESGLRFAGMCRWNMNDVFCFHINKRHYDDVIMGTIASQITSLTSVYSTVYSGADQSKHQSSTSLAFVWGIHRGPVNSPHKWPVMRKMLPFDDVIME